jgi:hypothetical protein
MIESLRFGLINRYKRGDWNRTKREFDLMANVVKFLKFSQNKLCNILIEKDAWYFRGRKTTRSEGLRMKKPDFGRIWSLERGLHEPFIRSCF